MQTQVLLGEALLLVGGDAASRIAAAREAAGWYRRVYEIQTRQPLRAEAACGLARALVAQREPAAMDAARRLFDECLGPYQAWGLVHPETRRAVLQAAEQVYADTAPSRVAPVGSEG